MAGAAQRARNRGRLRVSRFVLNGEGDGERGAGCSLGVGLAERSSHQLVGARGWRPGRVIVAVVSPQGVGNGVPGGVGYGGVVVEPHRTGDSRAYVRPDVESARGQVGQAERGSVGQDFVAGDGLVGVGIDEGITDHLARLGALGRSVVSHVKRHHPPHSPLGNVGRGQVTRSGSPLFPDVGGVFVVGVGGGGVAKGNLAAVVVESHRAGRHRRHLHVQFPAQQLRLTVLVGFDDGAGAFGLDVQNPELGGVVDDPRDAAQPQRLGVELTRPHPLGVIQENLHDHGVFHEQRPGSQAALVTRVSFPERNQVR